MLQDAHIGIGEHMVRFVHDDVGIIIRRKAVQPRCSAQRLHGADGHGHVAEQRGGRGFFQNGIDAGYNLQLVRRLRQQLFPVGEDQHARVVFDAVADHAGKHDCFARARRQHQKRFPVLPPSLMDRRNRIPLIRSQFHQNPPFFHDGSAVSTGAFFTQSCCSG